MPSTLAEGTLVKILKYDKRPEFVGEEAEIGNFKDDTYECWMTAEQYEGSYALCTPDQFEVVGSQQAAAAAPAESTPSRFSVGDRVKGKESGKLGTVVSLDADGDPKVQMDGEDEAQQRFGDEFDVERGNFEVGMRVKGKETGKLGTVVSIDEDGDPKVQLDGEDEAKQRFGNEFEEVLTKFEVGDKVKGRESGKMGKVVAVDEDGDPKVLLDGEDEAKQRFASEYEIISRGGKSPSRSRSGDKKKKSKKKKSSSSSSSSSKSSKASSRERHRKRKSAFGRSAMEQREDEKRRARKAEKKMSKGADAALDFLGLR